MRSSVVLLVCAVLAGCGSEPGHGSAALLRAQFPDHAARVLGEHGGDALVATATGFVVRPAAVDPSRAARTAMTGAGTTGRVPLKVTVRCASPWPMASPSKCASRAPGARASRRQRPRLRTRRGDEASFWSATVSGYEEWLLVRVPHDAVVATWKSVVGRSASRVRRWRCSTRPGRRA